MGIRDFAKPKGAKKGGHRPGDGRLTAGDPDINAAGTAVALVEGDDLEGDVIICLNERSEVETIGLGFSPSIGRDCGSVAFATESGIFIRRGDSLTPVVEGDGIVPLVGIGPNTVFPLGPVVDMTPDGCFVAFVTTADLLPEEDGDVLPDVYVRSFSQGNHGACPNGMDNVVLASGLVDASQSERVLSPTISDDGERVAFSVEALDPSQSPIGNARIYLWDRADLNAARLIEEGVFSGGLRFLDFEIVPPLPAISADGQFVAFSLDDGDGIRQIYRWDAEEVVQVSAATAAPRGGAFEPSISGDGRFVSFSSNEPLVSGDTNASEDVFVWDALTDQLTRASVDGFGDEGDALASGAEGLGGVGSRSSSLAPDGRTVAFLTDSPSLLEAARGPRRNADLSEPPPSGAASPQLLEAVLLSPVVSEDLRVVQGGRLSDRLVGTEREELIEGLGGPDTIRSGGGDDRIFAGDGNDVAAGGKFNDLVDGGPGGDVLIGGPGLDRLKGRDGDDQLFGGAGSDRIDGGPGNDELYGGKGKDELEGGAGNDHLIGGPGADAFIYNRFSASVQDASSIGEDIIVDFKQGKDRIKIVSFNFVLGAPNVDDVPPLIFFEGIADFQDLSSNLRIRVSGNDTIIDLSDAFRDPFTGELRGTHTITVIGVPDLGPEDFVFE